MWPKRTLRDLLDIEHPIIQAPMAGASTPELAAAVCNAGGLGSLGVALADGAEIREQVRRLRALANRPFNLNFFAHPAAAQDPGRVARTMQRLAPYYDRLGLGAPSAALPDVAPGFDEARLEAALDLRPKVVSFHFGFPSDEAISRLKAAGILLMSSATSVAEARAIERAGLDVIIAQGWEAGGHRGAHRMNAPGDGVGSLALVPQIVDAVQLPVIAAGGIGDGRGIVAAFALGAAGVQVGTLFLAAPEAATDPRRRELLRAARDDDTVVTAAFSGRPARARRSPYTEAMRPAGEDLPPFPSLLALTRPLVEAAARAGSDDVSFHLYGQAAALAVDAPAAEIMERLIAETRRVFGQLAPDRHEA